jgi:hypothetical protein
MTLVDQLIERIERPTANDTEFDRVISETMAGFATGAISKADWTRIDRVAKRRLREWRREMGAERKRLPSLPSVTKIIKKVSK